DSLLDLDLGEPAAVAVVGPHVHADRVRFDGGRKGEHEGISAADRARDVQLVHPERRPAAHRLDGHGVRRVPVHLPDVVELHRPNDARGGEAQLDPAERRVREQPVRPAIA
ncbi:MAG: hypothetical protein ACK559_13540, partial [bacterium]